MRGYDVHIAPGLLNSAGAMIRKAAGGGAAAVITDSVVAALYARRLLASLENNGYRAALFEFPSGEGSKNTRTFTDAASFLASEGLTRSDVVVALGGGVVGDIAGFAAACYMRGIGLVQMPTTLLAAVDSSIGGKTGVNLPEGKNLLGAFHRPLSVICDTDLLNTLTEETYRDGCAEVVKYAMLADGGLLALLKEKRLADVIARCVAVKTAVVEKDEYERAENGERKKLNFGHTVGHAVERLSGYRVTHGNAVAAGMAVITRAAARAGICGGDCLQTLLLALRHFGLPENADYGAEELARACLSDKKRLPDAITLVLPLRVGECALKTIPLCELQPLIASGLTP
ncbi:MAG: 3-dehydroquinate synthase [Oscillospiraceae bacterium]|jgi:3-dehydroquinate synthase|nr:3-dehydroquinate synthase [Oscillospiraceae bacterium]